MLHKRYMGYDFEFWTKLEKQSDTSPETPEHMIFWTVPSMYRYPESELLIQCFSRSARPPKAIAKWGVCTTRGDTQYMFILSITTYSSAAYLPSGTQRQPRTWFVHGGFFVYFAECFAQPSFHAFVHKSHVAVSSFLF